MKGFRHFDDLFWKYMLAYKKRTVFTILGITLAVILFYGAGTVYTSTYHALAEHSKSVYGDYDVSGTVNPEEYHRLKDLDYVDEMLLYYQPEDVPTYLDLGNGDENGITIQYMETFEQSIFDYALLEGRYPENDKEVLLNQYQADYLEVEPGDTLSVYTYEYWIGDEHIGGPAEQRQYINSHAEKDENGELLDDSIAEVEKKIESRRVYQEFRVAGIYKGSVDTYDFDYVWIVGTTPLLSLIDRDQDYTALNVCVRFRNHRNYMDKLMKEEDIFLEENDSVTMYLKGYSSSEMDPLLQYILFMIAFIVLFWIAVIIIRNTFVMSMAERARDYGILRCMGISRYHLRRLLGKEGFSMAGIACILGIGITTLFLQFGKYIGVFRQLLKSIGIYEEFGASVSPWMVVGSIAFTFCAVLFSLLEPARQIGGMAPVDAILGTASIKKEKLRPRRGGLVRRIFGVEGEYAYKNLLRNKGKFIASIVGIAVSVVGLMISFDLIHIMKAGTENPDPGQRYDAYANFQNGKGKTNEDIEELLSELQELKSIESLRPCFAAYQPSDQKTYGLLTNRNGEKSYYTDYYANGFDESQVEELEGLLLEGSLDYEAMKEGGVIICRSTRSYNYIDGQWVESKRQQTDLQPGDTIWIPKEAMGYSYGDTINEKVFISTDGSLNEDAVLYCPVIAVIDYNPDSIAFDTPDVIFAKEFYQAHLVGEDMPAMGLYEIKVKCSAQYDTEEIIAFQKEHKAYYFSDSGVHEYENMLKGYQQLILLITAIIAAIGALNIFNTLSSNISLRKQEFRIMSAVGMSRKQIIKMLGLEGGLAAIIGGILGIGLGTLAGFWLTKFSEEISPAIKYQVPWAGIGTAALLVLVVTGVSIAIAGKDLKTWEE